MSGNRNTTSFSMAPISGNSTTSVARRNRVFIRAMLTAVMVTVRKVKCRKALRV